MILLLRNCESQSFILRKFGVIVKDKQEEPSSHTHMWTHGPESNWGRCCAAEKHCPPKLSSTLCYNYPNTCNVNTYCTCSGKQDCSSSIHTHKSISATHKIQANQCILIFLHPEPSTPPPTPSYHPVRSRRWFFGRSCTAHCSQASATLCPSPPSLHTLSHTTVLSGSVFMSSLAHQLFRHLPGHIHARTHRPSYSHRHRGKCWCTGLSCWSMGRALQWLSKGVASNKDTAVWNHSSFFFWIHHWSSRLHCSVTGSIVGWYRKCWDREGRGNEGLLTLIYLDIQTQLNRVGVAGGAQKYISLRMNQTP